MTVSVFANCVFFLRVKKLTIFEKNRLKKCIKENGGQITFVLNHECTHVVTDDVGALCSIHLKVIQKYQLPIVGVDFIWNSVEERRLLQADKPHQSLEYITGKENSCELVTWTEKDVETIATCEDNSRKEKDLSEKNESDDDSNIDGLRWFSKNDKSIPYFPEDFEVAKYDVLEKATAHGEYAVVELQCSQQHCDYPFRICVHYSASDGGDQDKKQFVPAKSSEKVRRSYVLCIEHLENADFQLRNYFPHEAEYLASVKLQEMLVAEAIDSNTLSEEVSVFVELIWAEALGHLDHLLAKPVTSISLNDVTKAEGVLLRAKNALNENQPPEKLTAMMSEFYKIIPHRNGLDNDVDKVLLSNKENLCQLIRDMLNIRETNMSVPNPSSLSKFRALRCKIEALDAKSEEFCNVKQVVEKNVDTCPVKVLQIYKVGRVTETASFESDLGNVQSLFHASSACNFLGILSRGLLLPKIVVEEYGVQRSDYGYFGSGIYFSNSIRTSIKYSQPSKTDGTRLLVICDVALGTCWKCCRPDSSLTAAPSGYDSVHGTPDGCFSVFEDDEFVVYRTSQVKIKYVVKFCLANEKVKEFHPVIRTEVEDQEDPEDLSRGPEDCEIPSRNLLNDITPGLLDRSGNPVPLRDVHIKGRVIDFVAEVVVYQTYENQSKSPIEAKYVFPLDDTAAVCGFEAFIKGKHIIGEVKEKEKAHHEYREAVSRGDGAYLMDQDAPDIFTVSVGNLPPSVKVLIKITYITELSYEKGCLSFHLPAAVAPWQQDKALNENTQDTVRKVSVKQVGTQPGDFSLEMSVEMPFKINDISSWTHQLKIKKTDCKAVIRTVEDSSLDLSGFAMEILIGDVHLPRMWVEKHPDKESEACMLVFQPEFEAAVDPLSTSGETIICLDCSNSMAGSEIQQAKQIALHALSLSSSTRLRVIKFGTDFIEFPFSSEGYPVGLKLVKQFIMSATATMGNSDLWKTLRYLNLLYPSKCKRNILLISDGHIQNAGLTLQMVKENTHHTRIFTCGVGPTANRHMLRSLSQYGAGAFEYFDAKSKYNWERKIKSQTTRMYSPACSAVSVKWQQFDTNAPELTYAPAQIQSLFNHERLLIYGFISHCTQATLNALIDNQELQTMVSTTELQKTTGTMLHKLAARAFIRDYEQGILDENEMEHEMKKQMLKSLIVQLSLENSIVTQFTSFVAIERRDVNEDQSADTLNVLELLAKEDVDILPYMQYRPTTPAVKNAASFGNKSILGTKPEASILFGASSASVQNEGSAPTLQSAHYLPPNRSTLFSLDSPLLSWISSEEDDSIELQTSTSLTHQKYIRTRNICHHHSSAPCFPQMKKATQQIQSPPFADDTISSEEEEFIPPCGMGLFQEFQERIPGVEFPSPAATQTRGGARTLLMEAPEVCHEVQASCFGHTFVPRSPEKYSLMTSDSIKLNADLVGTEPKAGLFDSRSIIDSTPAAGFSFGTAFAHALSKTSDSIKLNADLVGTVPKADLFITKGIFGTTPTAGFGTAFAPATSDSITLNADLVGTKPKAGLFGSRSIIDNTPAAGFSFGTAFAPATSDSIKLNADLIGTKPKAGIFDSQSIIGTTPTAGLFFGGAFVPAVSKTSDSIKLNADLVGTKPQAGLFDSRSIIDNTPAAGFSFGTAFAHAQSKTSDSIKLNADLVGTEPKAGLFGSQSIIGPTPTAGFSSDGAFASYHVRAPQGWKKGASLAESKGIGQVIGQSITGPTPTAGFSLFSAFAPATSANIKPKAVLRGTKGIVDTTAATDFSFGSPYTPALKECFLKKKKKKVASVTERQPLSSVSLPQLLELQHQDGFWQLTAELGTLLDLDVDHLVNVWLAKKGIRSLGPKGKEQLLQLIATLLVLQAILFKQFGGLVFKSLLKLNDSFPTWPFKSVKKAIEWARKTDRQFPAICQRLELGKDWDSATKKLLCIEVTGYFPPPPPLPSI